MLEAILLGRLAHALFELMEDMRPQILNSLFMPVSSLPGIGRKLEKVLTRLLQGGDSGAPARIVDILFHLPYQVVDRRRQPGIAHSQQGAVVTLKVHVDRHQPPPRGNRRIPYRIYVHDDTGEMAVVFFHAQPDWITRSLPIGETRFVSGRMEWFNGRPSMVHPDHVVTEAEFSELPLVEPVYPLTAGLSQKVMGKTVRAALALLPELPEWVEDGVLQRENWPGFSTALHRLHAPERLGDLDLQSPARRRLAHDELLAGQLALAMMRETMRKSRGKARVRTGRLADRIMTAFGHPLTGSQRQAIEDIYSDLAKPERMLRLLQGDVGSGKTIVALLAMVAAIEDGGQAAIMVPTEILARQHHATIKALCDAAEIRLAILTGREKGQKREQILAVLKTGGIDLLVGTHALFQAAVEFRDLALAVIDEQHRFGVHQRMALGGKGAAPDVLVMTATPIPRTLVLTYFGDMDVSSLTDKPPGRRTVKTTAMPLSRLDELIGRVGKALDRGERLYWICPLVEESDEIRATAVEDRFRMLAKKFGERVGLVHGRMKSAEKDAAMASFRDGRICLLVATTVIEVGVDVPEATVMIVEHAERFGLAQLHQLRGRVGRGDRPSSCILLYRSPLGETARARLKVMRETDDGFRIAETDLRLRGEGEILGTRQSGLPGFSLANAEAHEDILEMARNDARNIMSTLPGLSGERGEALRTLLYLFGQDQAVRLLRAG